MLQTLAITDFFLLFLHQCCEIVTTLQLSRVEQQQVQRFYSQWKGMLHHGNRLSCQMVFIVVLMDLHSDMVLCQYVN